mgnify:CR=1 FL=1
MGKTNPTQIYIDDSGKVHVSYQCDSCSEWVHTDDHCGYGEDYLCSDCFVPATTDEDIQHAMALDSHAVNRMYIHDWLIFLGEDNPIGCDIAIHKSMVGSSRESFADCSTPDPEEDVTRFGPGSLSFSMTSIDALHMDVHHVHTLWDEGYLNDECIKIFNAQGGAKATVPVLRSALKLLSVYREDHACTDEDCEECEIVLAAESALGGAK